MSTMEMFEIACEKLGVISMVTLLLKKDPDRVLKSVECWVCENKENRKLFAIIVKELNHFYG